VLLAGEGAAPPVGVPVLAHAEGIVLIAPGKVLGSMAPGNVLGSIATGNVLGSIAGPLLDSIELGMRVSP
jgi:hypothetical protein